MEKSKLTKKELLLKEKEEERVFLMKCIELCQSLPVLWKVKSDDYRDRDKKAQAYEKLLELYHERYPKATREDLAKKFDSLRTNFRKELKKMNDSKKSGAGAEEVYESTLWYFDSMKFLIDQETPSDSINICEDESEGSVVDFSVIHDTENAVSSTPRPTKKKRPQPKDPADELIRLACTRLQEPVSAELQVATTWATELMKMAPQQQLSAKKFINEIIFEGQMGTLHRGSVLINEPARTSTPLSHGSYSSASNYSQMQNLAFSESVDQNQGSVANFFSSLQ